MRTIEERARMISSLLPGVDRPAIDKQAREELRALVEEIVSYAKDLRWDCFGLCAKSIQHKFLDPPSAEEVVREAMLKCADPIENWRTCASPEYIVSALRKAGLLREEAP